MSVVANSKFHLLMKFANWTLEPDSLEKAIATLLKCLKADYRHEFLLIPAKKESI